MKKFLFSIFVLVAGVMLTSCGNSRDKIVYLQGADEMGTFQNAFDFNARIQTEDQLAILVSCKEQELAMPFNLSIQSSPYMYGGGAGSTSNRIPGSVQMGNSQYSTTLSYWVDRQGCIQYPIMGKFKVEGMTRTQLADSIQSFLIHNGYIQDPIVNVYFCNSHVSVLGEVNQPGVKSFSNDRVSIFDAIALAGDINIFGERDKVRIIRDENGKINIYSVDLRDPNILTSEHFYLRHNDIVYVEPNNTKASNREVSSLYTFGISIVSLMATLANIIINVTR